MDKTDTHKKAILAALEKSNGVVTAACKAAKVSRSAFYEWLKEDPEFKAQVDDLNEVAIDTVETALFDLVKEKNPTAIIFFLKTRAKHRGYAERQEVDMSTTITGATVGAMPGKVIDQILALVNENGGG